MVLYQIRLNTYCILRRGPPMEERGTANGLCLLGQLAAALAESSRQLRERLEVLVGQRLIAEFPEVLGRLQLGRVGWQGDQLDPFGALHLRARVPPRSVQHQEDALPGSDLLLLRERLQDRGED